jgi:hypothetical protein
MIVQRVRRMYYRAPHALLFSCCYIIVVSASATGR